MSSDPTAHLPAGWRMVQLSEVAEHSLGKMLDAQKNRGRPMPYLRNPNVRWFDVDTTNLQEMPFESHELDRYGLQAGDVVVCEGGEAGRAAIWDGRLPDLKFQKAIHRVRPGTDLHNRFLVYRLMADYHNGHLADYYTGATIKHLTGQDLARYRIPLPPIGEQRRIAEVLDRAEALRAKRRAALAQLDTLTQSIFLDLFGDPVTNPKSWPVTTIGEVADVQGGLQVTSARKSCPREVPYLRVANVYRGHLDLGEIKTIRATDAEIARTTLLKNDLLVVEGHGNPAEIGRGALWDGSIEGCVHQNHIIRARFKGAEIVPLYVCEYFNSPGGRRHLLRAGKTTSGLNTISVSDVRATPIAVPPLELQRRFARKVAAVDKLKSAHRASLAKLDALFASLQHRAFRGEL